MQFVQILIISVTIVVVAVPEGWRPDPLHRISYGTNTFARFALGGHSRPGFCHEAND